MTFVGIGANGNAEAKEAEAKPEREADVHLHQVDSYLAELEADPDGWDFEGKRYENAKRIKQEVRPDCSRACP